MKISLGRKLGLAFAFVSFLTVGLSLVTYWKVSTMRAVEEQMLTLRVPILMYSHSLVSDLNDSANYLKDYILMAEDAEIARKDHEAQVEMEQRIRADVQGLKNLAPRFTLQANRDRVAKLEERLNRAQQLEAEIYRMRKPGNPATQLAAARFMAERITPFHDETEAIANEITVSSRELIEQEGARGRAAASSTVFLLAVATLGVLLVSFLAAFFLSRAISTEVKELLGRAKSIASGDLTGEPLKPRSKDEIAELSLAVNDMTASLRHLLSDIAGGVQTLSSSATRLSSVSSQTASGVSSMSEKTNGVATAAEEASASTMSVASGMEQSSASLTSVASATEQMSATVADIAANTARARVTSEQASSKAVTITDQMQKLGAAAEEIGQVTETITNISAQTNLLALNATIEAARAGAAGKGFAVVANEIKELARQTAEATEDIKERIAGVQSSTSSAIADIAQITAVIKEVSGIVSSIAAAIEEQAAVTKDVAGNIAQASAGVRDANSHVAQTAEVSRSIARDIAGVNAEVSDMRRGGEQVQASAAELSQLADQLRLQVAQFRM